jgi:glycosyltransferase involved in cell wall biosynthesis
MWHLRDAWNSSVARRFRQILTETPPDVMHSHVIDGFSPAIWAAAKKREVPIVHTAHDYHLACPRSSLLTRQGTPCASPNIGCQIFRAWHLSRTRHIDVFCAPSRFVMNYHERHGLRAKNTRIVHNGIPLPLRADVPRSEGNIELLFAARLTADKGTAVVLEAMRQLPRSLAVHLTVMGKGPMEDVVRAAAENDRRITYLGYVKGDEKWRFFAAADAVLMPSMYYEPAGLVIVEAAAAGTGVIASRIGGIPEFVSEENNGLLIAPNDPGALAAAILRIATEPGLRNTFRTRGPDFAKHFSVDRMVEDYLDAYCSAIADKAPLLKT